MLVIWGEVRSIILKSTSLLTLFLSLGIFIYNCSTSASLYREGNPYWVGWSSKAFQCIEKGLNRLPANNKVQIQIQDPLLYSRVIEIGFPNQRFTDSISDLKISEKVSIYDKEISLIHCEPWKIYISKHKNE